MKAIGICGSPRKEGNTEFLVRRCLDRIGEIMRRHNYKGYISLEFEGNADPMEAVPKSLELFRESFYYEL